MDLFAGGGFTLDGFQALELCNKLNLNLHCLFLNP